MESRTLKITIAASGAAVLAGLLLLGPRAPRLEAGDLIKVPIFERSALPPAPLGQESFKADNHSAVKILGADQHAIQVEIRQGSNKGRSGWVFEQWVKK